VTHLRVDLNPLKVLEAASESIIVTTADLNSPGPFIVYANPAFEHMTGWTAAEVYGESPRLLQGEETDRSIFDDMRETLQSGGRWEGQTVNYRKDGSPFVMEWSITPVLNDELQPESYVAVQRDVTARVQAERQIAEAREAAQEAERRKMNLARYFSPRTVEILAERDEPLGKVRRQNVAVLVIDIVGFTTISENLPPERVVAILRSFYRRMTAIVFQHEGSVEHFAGDALLAVFGMPDASHKDATNASICAVEMQEELERWNTKRTMAKHNRIEACITSHYGEVVLGDIGTRRSMSYTVIGDTVNTASRMQELCRSLKLGLLVTQDLIDKATLESEKTEPTLVRFVDAGTHALRGRNRLIGVLTVEN
jgi:PAS domain S-box-containing protein